MDIRINTVCIYTIQRYVISLYVICKYNIHSGICNKFRMDICINTACIYSGICIYIYIYSIYIAYIAVYVYIYIAYIAVYVYIYIHIYIYTHIQRYVISLFSRNQRFINACIAGLKLGGTEGWIVAPGIPAIFRGCLLLPVQQQRGMFKGFSDFRDNLGVFRDQQGLHNCRK